VILPALQGVGLEPAGGDASFFLWLRVPRDGDAEAFALRLLDELGIVVAPGPFFGRGGEGHVRAALVPTLDECRRAAQLLESFA
jgi:aspartate/methionine/tyrosine aminotransferase